MPGGNLHIDRSPAEPAEPKKPGSAGNPLPHLHSRYNPQGEAVRYLDSLNLKDTIKCFILIEPGLGYMIPVLLERFAKSKIIVLHTESGACRNEEQISLNERNSCAVHYGANGASINKFLETEVPEIDADCVKIIEWRPSLNYYKEEYVTLLSQTAGFLKRLDAEKRTTAAFGKRWIKNFFKNLEVLNKTLLYRQTSLPVIVTGSGPGLEEAMTVIKNNQNNCLIIAASSSLTALDANGIEADIVIATDGGNWALRHLYPCVRKKMSPDFAYAANLCAALPSQTKETPFLIINDGSFWQSIVLRELLIPSVIIGQRGTVTAAAVELAMLLSGGNIYLAGMDFSNNDIKTHARPYAFDNLFFGEANRFLPVYTTYFSRSSLLKDGGSMNIYAAWFKNRLSSWEKRIFSLTNHSIFNHAIPEKQTKIKNTKEIFNIKNVKEDPSMFREKGLSALVSALKNSEYADDLTKELTPLLFPASKANVTAKDLEKTLRKELIRT